jgi:creatinine amidohydrolase/Fe(II)-dependent formamide hydrolase-like protein
MGDPAATTPEKGRSLLDAVTDELVRFIDAFSNWPTLQKIGPKNLE